MIAQSFPERIQVRINVLVTEGMKRRNAAWLALMEDWESQQKVIDAARKADKELRPDFSSWDEHDWVEAASELRAALAALATVAPQEEES